MTIKEIITQMWAAIKARFSTATNLVNGSAAGSLRTSFAKAEDESYTMGVFCFAEGKDCMAKDYVSHAEGNGTIAHAYQHVQGKYNVEDPNSRYIHIVGGGSEEARSNLYTLDMNGNAWFKGKVYSGGADVDDKQNAKTFATVDYFNNLAVGRWCDTTGSDHLICGNGNEPDTENRFAFIVGAGDDTSQHNGFTVDRYGYAWVLGDLYVGGTWDEPHFRLRRFKVDTEAELKSINQSLENHFKLIDELENRVIHLEHLHEE